MGIIELYFLQTQDCFQFLQDTGTREQYNQTIIIPYLLKFDNKGQVYYFYYPPLFGYLNS